MLRRRTVYGSVKAKKPCPTKPAFTPRKNELSTRLYKKHYQRSSFIRYSCVLHFVNQTRPVRDIFASTFICQPGTHVSGDACKRRELVPRRHRLCLRQLAQERRLSDAGEPDHRDAPVSASRHIETLGWRVFPAATAAAVREIGDMGSPRSIWCCGMGIGCRAAE